MRPYCTAIFQKSCPRNPPRTERDLSKAYKCIRIKDKTGGADCCPGDGKSAGGDRKPPFAAVYRRRQKAILPLTDRKRKWSVCRAR